MFGRHRATALRVACGLNRFVLTWGQHKDGLNLHQLLPCNLSRSKVLLQFLHDSSGSNTAEQVAIVFVITVDSFLEE